MKLYLSGPMTGLQDMNYPAFHEAAGKLREMGHEVLSPAERELTVPQTDEFWHDLMKRGIRMLLECECLVQLDKWWDSKGACAEFQVAVALGMNVYYFRFFDDVGPLLIRAPVLGG